MDPISAAIGGGILAIGNLFTSILSSEYKKEEEKRKYQLSAIESAYKSRLGAQQRMGEATGGNLRNIVSQMTQILK